MQLLVFGLVHAGCLKTTNNVQMRIHRGDESSIDAAAVPPELGVSLQKLHHFRRGAILGAGLQSVDDRSLARDILLRSPLYDFAQMLAPIVWRCTTDANGRIEFRSAPAETLALWDESVLAVDAHDSLFVWSGKAVLNEDYDPLRKACMSFLLDRSKRRFPAPKLYGLIEGDPMCRKLTTRLVPSHGDPHEHQLAHYTDLKLLSSNSIDLLRAKFRVYDPKNDSSFQSWFWKAVKVVHGGNTLCS